MEKLEDKNTTSSAERREWESPELFIEDMATITESSNIAVPRQEDGFYQS